MRTVGSGLFLPPFEALADPLTIARLAAEAEEAGWTGVFVWDHLRWCEPISAIADPWITLAAVATATSRIRLGPMVTPLPRRRPAKVAKETVSLDRLSAGRLTFGVGLGSDAYGNEYTKTGEEVDDRKRAAMLDESLEVITRAWTGEEVVHRGEHYTVDGVRFLPKPVQQPRIPIWVAGLIGNKRPRRRAARYDGYFPVFLRPRPGGRGGRRYHRARPERQLRFRGSAVTGDGSGTLHRCGGDMVGGGIPLGVDDSGSCQRSDSRRTVGMSGKSPAAQLAFEPSR